MMRRLSKWAGVLLAMSLVLGFPFVASVQPAGAAGQFTVEFNADGTINQVYSVGIASLAGNTPVKPDPNNMGGLSSHLQGKLVNNIRSVTIVTTLGDPCIMDSNGQLWCWQ